MFGGIFILIGILILLQAAGVFGTLSSGLIWGVAFIAIGVFVVIRRSARRQRRAEWIAKHHPSKQPHSNSGDVSQ